MLKIGVTFKVSSTCANMFFALSGGGGGIETIAGPMQSSCTGFSPTLKKSHYISSSEEVSSDVSVSLLMSLLLFWFLLMELDISELQQKMSI